MTLDKTARDELHTYQRELCASIADAARTKQIACAHIAELGKARFAASVRRSGPGASDARHNK